MMDGWMEKRKIGRYWMCRMMSERRKRFPVDREPDTRYLGLGKFLMGAPCPGGHWEGTGWA